MINSKQDELEQAVREVTIELLDCGGANAYWIMDWLCEDRPDLEKKYGRAEIEARAEDVLADDVPEFSERFQKMFDDFNTKYFAGSLPPHTVRVVYAIDEYGDRQFPDPLTSRIDLENHVIRLRFTHLAEAVMTDCLLHEMVHAAIGGQDDERCCAELARLRDLGAPAIDWARSTLPLDESNGTSF